MPHGMPQLVFSLSFHLLLIPRLMPQPHVKARPGCRPAGVAFAEPAMMRPYRFTFLSVCQLSLPVRMRPTSNLSEEAGESLRSAPSPCIRTAGRIVLLAESTAKATATAPRETAIAATERRFTCQPPASRPRLVMRDPSFV